MHPFAVRGGNAVIKSESARGSGTSLDTPHIHFLSLSPFISLFPLCKFAQLVAAEILSSPFAIHAMRRTDRQLYCTVKGWVRDPPRRIETTTHAKRSNGSDRGNGVMGDDNNGSAQFSGNSVSLAEVCKGKSSAYAYGPYADAPQAIGFKVRSALWKGIGAFLYCQLSCTTSTRATQRDFKYSDSLPCLLVFPRLYTSFITISSLLASCDTSSPTSGHHICAPRARESFRPLGITLGHPGLPSAGHWLWFWSVGGVHGTDGRCCSRSGCPWARNCFCICVK